MAVVWFGLREGIGSAENKRMGATSRRAEHVLERSNKLAKVEREEQIMTGTFGRKKTKGLRNDCQRGQMWKNRHCRYAQNLADTLQMSCQKAQLHLSAVSTSVSLFVVCHVTLSAEKSVNTSYQQKHCFAIYGSLFQNWRFHSFFHPQFRFVVKEIRLYFPPRLSSLNNHTFCCTNPHYFFEFHLRL